MSIPPDRQRELLQEMRDFAAGPKFLSGDVFEFIEKDDTYLSLKSALGVEGVLREGYLLRINCLLKHPNKNVTIQMEREIDGRSRPFIRIEWNPKTQHTNPNKGPSQYRLKKIDTSHIHRPEENFELGLEKAILRGNLPIAIPLESNPQDWEALMALAGGLLNVRDLAKIKEPPWKAMLPGI